MMQSDITFDDKTFDDNKLDRIGFMGMH